jgi:hypothetical protein
MTLKTLPDLVTQAIHNVIGNGPTKLHEPTFDGNETQYVQDCIESTYVSSVGKYVDQFEIELVCESYTIGDTFFPTEKTIRPITAGKPMLVYGPKSFLARIKALGFQTYSNCWSENYDQLEGPARWQAIRLIIDSLINLNDFQRAQLMERAQATAIYNRYHLKKLITQ